MRAALIEEVVDDEQSEAMGVVTLIYDHHSSRIAERLTVLQHEHLDQVVTTTHVHLDERRCLEVILLRGPAGHVRELADNLIGSKGVETGRLVLASAAAVATRHDRAASQHHSHNHAQHIHHQHEHDHEQGNEQDAR
jgi:CopG family nickel-responsive transcriptional regulator